MTTLTEAKERPILFSTPMVKAILSLIKIITRRTKGLDKINAEPDQWNLIHAGSYKARTVKGDIVERFGVLFQHKEHLQEVIGIPCPYGKPGDVLWVRETWAPFNGDCGIGCEYGCHCPAYIYKTDNDDTEVSWKPSIHMPRAACRLRLEIVSITVERLQDITEEDAIREGIYQEGHLFKDYIKADYWALNAKHSFETLWKSINGADSWNANPWVWRIDFKKL